MTQQYPLANSDQERQRLKAQAEALIPLTQCMLSGAGIGAGARVLELGCGNGQVTTLIATDVGPSGEVVALDREPSQVAAARARLHASPCRNVTFVTADVQSYLPAGEFDAVVGRYVLMYLPDPEAIIAKAVRWLRPGGALGFLEMDFFRGVRSRIWPGGMGSRFLTKPDALSLTAPARFQSAGRDSGRYAARGVRTWSGSWSGAR